MYRKMGIVPQNEPISVEDMSIGSENLNRLVKSWHSIYPSLWKYKIIYLFPQTSQYVYSLNTTTTDHATISYVSTTTSANAISGATSIVVTSATGFTNGYNIGIILDSGDIQWTTISSSAGTTINLGAALTDDVASGNVVYVYQTKCQKPERVYSAYRLSSSGSETPILVIPRNTYLNQSIKSNEGTITQVYYDKQLTTGIVNLWQAPQDATDVIKLNVSYPFEDFDSATDEPDFPVEWLDAIIFNCAYRTSFDKQINSQKRAELKQMAFETLTDAKRYDQEIQDFYLELSTTPYES
jgi:hypothetical protein